MGVQTADGHQAAQVAALVVGLVVLVEAHLGWRPALQIACAVDGAEALAVGYNESRMWNVMSEKQTREHPHAVRMMETPTVQWFEFEQALSCKNKTCFRIIS